MDGSESTSKSSKDAKYIDLDLVLVLSQCVQK